MSVCCRCVCLCLSNCVCCAGEGANTAMPVAVPVHFFSASHPSVRSDIMHRHQIRGVKFLQRDFMGFRVGGSCGASDIPLLLTSFYLLWHSETRITSGSAWNMVLWRTHLLGKHNQAMEILVNRNAGATGRTGEDREEREEREREKERKRERERRSPPLGPPVSSPKGKKYSETNGRKMKISNALQNSGWKRPILYVHLSHLSLSHLSYLSSLSSLSHLSISHSFLSSIVFLPSSLLFHLLFHLLISSLQRKREIEGETGERKEREAEREGKRSHVHQKFTDSEP